jgi:hypothetical protein
VVICAAVLSCCHHIRLQQAHVLVHYVSCCKHIPCARGTNRQSARMQSKSASQTAAVTHAPALTCTLLQDVCIDVGHNTTVLTFESLCVCGAHSSVGSSSSCPIILINITARQLLLMFTTATYLSSRAKTMLKVFIQCTVQNHRL